MGNLPKEFRLGETEKAVRFCLYFDRLPSGTCFNTKFVSRILNLREEQVRRYFNHLKILGEVYIMPSKEMNKGNHKKENEFIKN